MASRSCGQPVLNRAIAEILARTYAVVIGADDRKRLGERNKLRSLADGVVELQLTRRVAARPFRQTDRVKLFEMVSPSLSAHYGRPFTMHAGIILPEGWKDIAAYVVVLAVLLVKPSGIFGETIRKKV